MNFTAAARSAGVLRGGSDYRYGQITPCTGVAPVVVSVQFSNHSWVHDNLRRSICSVTLRHLAAHRGHKRIEHLGFLY